MIRWRRRRGGVLDEEQLAIAVAQKIDRREQREEKEEGGRGVEKATAPSIGMRGGRVGRVERMGRIRGGRGGRGRRGRRWRRRARGVLGGGDFAVEPGELLAGEGTLPAEFGEAIGMFGHDGSFVNFSRRRQSTKKRRRNPALKGGGDPAGEGGSARDDLDLAVDLVELDGAVLEREERPITADADVLARMEAGAPLTDDDRAGEDGLAAEAFYAEPFRMTLAAVARCSLTCFMRHGGWIP